MEVNLLHYTPLTITDQAISKCWDKECDPLNPNEEKITKIVKKFKHQSTVEHLSYNFNIAGVSRALLQELARHRIASYSVKSTRYTLKELKTEMQFNDFHNEIQYNRSKDYVVYTSNKDVNAAIFYALANLQELIKAGVSNDIAKFALPEAYKTELMWTINARSLMNFLSLRSDKAALWEIRALAWEVYNQLPQDHQFLFNDCMKIYID